MISKSHSEVFYLRIMSGNVKLGLMELRKIRANCISGTRCLLASQCALCSQPVKCVIRQWPINASFRVLGFGNVRNKREPGEHDQRQESGVSVRSRFFASGLLRFRACPNQSSTMADDDHEQDRAGWRLS
jgi:hypothetical protein